MLAFQDILTLRTWSGVIISAKEIGKVSISFFFVNNAVVSLSVFTVQGPWIVVLTILRREGWLAVLKELWHIFFIMRYWVETFTLLTKFPQEHFYVKNVPISNFCACAKGCFWNLIRLYRPVIWHFKLSSSFLQLERDCGLDTFHIYISLATCPGS